MSGDYESCHYRTLGVAKDATQEEIKAAFRKLSKETHPDVAGRQADTDRFKRISNAASVLTNAKERKAYDNQHLSTAFRPSGFGHDNFHRRARPHHHDKPGGQAPKGFTHVLLTMFRPKNMILGPIAVFATVSAIQYALGIDSDSKNKFRHQQDAEQVQAWRNPSTGKWETPAPWDPVYQQLKPTLEFVPRDQVQTRHR